jgi:predicted DNA-binding ribbon-helix-helix protein
MLGANIPAAGIGVAACGLGSEHYLFGPAAGRVRHGRWPTTRQPARGSQWASWGPCFMRAAGPLRQIATPMPRGRLVSRNVGTGPTRTSMRLEPEFWDALREICLREEIGLDELTSRAVRVHPGRGRTSAVRVFTVSYFREAAPSRIQAHKP